MASVDTLTLVTLVRFQVTISLDQGTSVFIEKMTNEILFGFCTEVTFITFEWLLIGGIQLVIEA